MTSRERQAFEKKIHASMAELVQMPLFADFIQLLRQQRESVIIDACMESTVASQRASMAAIGELRAYSAIIATYDDHLTRAQDDRDQSSP